VVGPAAALEAADEEDDTTSSRKTSAVDETMVVEVKELDEKNNKHESPLHSDA
jgi:hypothetical protein